MFCRVGRSGPPLECVVLFDIQRCILLQTVLGNSNKLNKCAFVSESFNSVLFPLSDSSRQISSADALKCNPHSNNNIPDDDNNNNSGRLMHFVFISSRFA